MSIPCWIGSVRRRCTERAPTAPLARALAAIGMAASCVLGGIAPSSAQEALPPAAPEGFQLYRVEVVIFEQSQAPGRPEDPGPPPLPPQPSEGSALIPGIFVEQAEPLPQAAPPGPEIVVEAPAEETEPAPLFFEPVELQDLADVARTLDRRPGYRVLASEAWRQPGFPQEQSQPVDLEVLARLRTLIADAAASGVRDGPAGRGSSDARAAATDPGSGSASDDGALEATATLWLGRYLHLRIDAESETEAGIGRLAESRRMRSGELHYFDSPRLGAIAIVIPEDAPEETAKPDDPAAETAGATGAPPGSF